MASSDSENYELESVGSEVSNSVHGDDKVIRFTIDSEMHRKYNHFNAAGTELTVRLLPPAPGDDSDALTHFQASVNDLFDYALRDVRDSDMVGITIQNEVNLLDKPIGISFRRKDQLSAEVIWSVFGKVAQSNARFNAMDKLILVIHSVKMPVGFGRVKTMGRPLSVMAHVKHSIINVTAESNCLAHALIIGIARLTKDPNYKAYRQGRKILPEVQHLLQTTGINLENGGGIRKIQQFQDHFTEYKIVVYGGLHCSDILFEGRVTSAKRVNLLYDEINRHFHEITNLTGAMSKQFICEGCSKSC